MIILYSIILVEDDSMQRNNLKKMLISTGELFKIYEADCENTALDIIKNNEINMFLIDISLKESSGLDLAMKLRSIPKYEFRPIIFLTTHVEYITQAFKQTHCYDYILKPYDTEDVQAMLKKLILNDVNNLNDKNGNSEGNREVVIMLKNGIYVGIKIDDILFIEAKGRNCEVNTDNGTYNAINTSLIKMLPLINCEYIIQSHKAFAVNKNYICKIERLDFRLSEVHFTNSSKTALLGYKYKENVISEFKKGKVILC